jgi:AcrR family transcriptional regulator
MARPRAQDYDEKRLGILQKSAELFAQFGYPGASINMIADACGVSKALIYHYYHDKESVLFDILATHLRELLRVVREAARSTKSPRERLNSMAIALLEAYRGADSEHQVQITSLKLLPADKQQMLKDMERELVALFSDVVAAAVPKVGRDRKLLKPVTMSLFGMLNWHYLWFREGRGMTRAAYAKLATGLVLSGVEAAVEDAVSSVEPASRKIAR